jgi:hypothetical protein
MNHTQLYIQATKVPSRQFLTTYLSKKFWEEPERLLSVLRPEETGKLKLNMYIEICIIYRIVSKFILNQSYLVSDALFLVSSPVRY